MLCHVNVFLRFSFSCFLSLSVSSSRPLRHGGGRRRADQLLVKVGVLHAGLLSVEDQLLKDRASVITTIEA